MSKDQFLETFVFSVYGPYLLILSCGFLLGITRLRQLSLPGKGIWLIVTISLFMEIASRILLYQINLTGPAYHILTLLHFLLYGWTYSKFAINSTYSKVFLISGIFLAGYSIANMIWIVDFFANPTVAFTVFNAFAVVASVFSFFDMLKNPVNQPLFTQSLFWFNMGTLLFFASTFFIYGLQDYFLAKKELPPQWSYYLQYGMNYYLYISYFIAIRLDSRKPSDSRV